MDIISYESIDNLNFRDDYSTIKRKLENYALDENLQKFMDKINPRIYIKELDLMINFQEDNKSVRFFEFFENATNIYLGGINLKSIEYRDLEKNIKEKDPNLEISESGFTSKKFGFRVSRTLLDSEYTNELDSILVFNDNYLSEPKTDLSELYKSIMGEDYEL